MSPYLIVYLLLFSSSLWEIISGTKKRTKLYNFLFSIILAMCSFRYGQGTDYFHYQAIYESFDNSFFANILLYRDVFFSLIFYLLKYYNLSFEFFISLISIFSLLLVDRFLRKQASYPIFGLFIAYSLFHLTYHYSAIREGLAISFFLGVMIPLLLEGKLKKYYICGVICSMMHLSAGITLLLPLMIKIDVKKYFIPIFFISGLLSMFVWNIPVFKSEIILGRVEDYTEEKMGIMPILSRAIGILPIFIYSTKKNHNLTIKIYLSFIFLYMIFVSNSTLAARVSIYTHFLIVVVWGYVLENLKVRKRLPIFLLMSCFLFVMYYKCINSYIVNGDYHKTVTVLNYPYCSIFNKDDIKHYKSIE